MLLECDAMEYATRYRFRTKIVGLEDQFKLAASGTQPMGVLEGIAPGLTVEIMVQAVNGSAQGVPSDSILVTIPAAESAATKPVVSEADLAPLAAIVPNGTSNGNGNSNGNGSHALNRLS